MKKFLFIKWQDFKVWFSKQIPNINYHLKSLSQSFLSGFALYLIANWGIITTGKLDKATTLGIIIAAARSGIKIVWALVVPQILALLQKMANWKNS